MLTVTIQEPASGSVVDEFDVVAVTVRLPNCPACDNHRGNGTCTHCGPACLACKFRGGVLVSDPPPVPPSVESGARAPIQGES